MPSHFHSAMKSRGIERGNPSSSSACASITRAERRRIDADAASRRGLRARRTARRKAARGRARPARSRRLLVAERGDRGLGEPRRDADAQAAGDELEQRPAAGLVERVEPARELRRAVRALPSEARVVTTSERVGLRFTPPPDGEGRPRGGRVGTLRTAPLTRLASLGPSPLRGRASRPHQRDRLRQVADIVVGQCEQHRIGALGDQRADDAGLGVAERQRAGDRRQRVAAVRIGRLRGNSPRSAAAWRCGPARRRGGRAGRRSGSCVGLAAVGCRPSPSSSSP